jgi:endonuclease/exonuclease/phosphatase family metal-dependent hydrolase
VDIAIDSDTLHLYNVHLGTALLERHHQAERLSAIVHDRRVGTPKVVLGDFNEWLRGRATAVLNERLQSVDLRQTPAAAAHLPGRVSGATPRPHLLRRARWTS